MITQYFLMTFWSVLELAMHFGVDLFKSIENISRIAISKQTKPRFDDSCNAMVVVESETGQLL